MTSLRDLIPDLQRTDPGRPRITWYALGGDADGERVELSGAVLANWASKAANLLQDELDAGPGTRVHLDLPPHWRSLYWAVATWAVGGTLVADAQDADVVVTDDPARTGRTDVVVTLAALARSASVAVPAGALDEARELATFGDVFTPYAPAGDGPAIDDPATPATAAPAPARRALHVVGADGPATTAWLAHVGPLLAAGGSVVLVRVEPGTDPGRLDRVAAQENAAQEPPAA